MKIANCEFCGKQFEQIRTTGKYCSPSCRVKACNTRKEIAAESTNASDDYQDVMKINDTINDKNGTTSSDITVNKESENVKKPLSNPGFSSKNQSSQASQSNNIPIIANYLIKNKDIVGLFVAGGTLFWVNKLLSQQADRETKNETL